MKKNTWITSCDWFAVSCRRPVADYAVQPISCEYGGYHFVIVKGTERHPYYQESVSVMFGTHDVATLFYMCKRPEHRESCQIKMANSRLYFYGWAEELQALIRALGWKFVMVNRIDICADFNYFANGRLPLSFVQDYLSKPSASRPSFIRRGSNRFRAYGEKPRGSLLYETLSWGTRESPVQVNLYNKSVELQGHDKQWIRQKWEAAGLRDGEDAAGKKWYVWRVEFSVNPSNVSWKSTEAADVQVRELSLDDVRAQGQCDLTFSAMLPRYFQFYYLSRSDIKAKKRVRDLTPVVLFTDVDRVSVKPSIVRYFRKSNRSDRMAYKRLMDYKEVMSLSPKEVEAWDVVLKRVASSFAFSQPDNMAEDVLSSWLASCFRGASASDSIKDERLYKRECARLVRMLQGAHDEDTEAFALAVARFQEWAQDDAFKAMLTHANEIGASYLPDDAIAEQMDEWDEEDAFLSQFGLA